MEVNPTYKPQTINAMERLERRLQGNPLARKHWRKRSDFIRFLGRTSVTFLSGDAKANVVGAVASLLLILNEAQDIDPAVYDRNFAPMAASTNATRLFMGTAWTSRTLLSRELRAAHPHRCSVCGAGAQRSWHVAKELDDDELEESSDDELEESAAEKAAVAAIDAFARTLEEQVAWLAGGDKAGRVQARRNVDRLRRAMEALGEMLDEIAAEEDDGGKGDLEDPYAAAARLLAETYRTAFGT